MSYKIVKKEDAVTYNPPGHFDMRATRLHNPQDVNDGHITVGISHFLPGGGCEFGANALESIYYILEGKMELTAEEEISVLEVGDSFHCGPGTKKSIKNQWQDCCKMMVILTKPE